jgi:hypothetical protein
LYFLLTFLESSFEEAQEEDDSTEGEADEEEDK